jgi:hypothetical protein
MSLSIVSQKEEELNDLIELVRSTESCMFRKKRDLPDWYHQDIVKAQEQEIKAVEPDINVIKYMKENKNLCGWVKSSLVFNRCLDIYLNNQYYWCQQFKQDEHHPELIEKISELELWFSKIIEYPPKRPILKSKKSKQNFKKENYLESLEAWVQREHCKYKYCRSYYCPNNIVKLLDKQKLLEQQSLLIRQYEDVKKYYENEKQWTEEIIKGHQN